jgi:hypothetical protein
VEERRCIDPKASRRHTRVQHIKYWLTSLALVGLYPETPTTDCSNRLMVTVITFLLSFGHGSVEANISKVVVALRNWTKLAPACEKQGKSSFRKKRLRVRAELIHVTRENWQPYVLRSLHDHPSLNKAVDCSPSAVKSIGQPPVEEQLDFRVSKYFSPLLCSGWPEQSKNPTSQEKWMCYQVLFCRWRDRWEEKKLRSIDEGRE